MPHKAPKIIGFDTETVLTKQGKFLVQKFYSAQFYSPELNINAFLTNPLEVREMFRHKNRGAIFLALNAEFDFAVLAKALSGMDINLKCLYNKSRFLYGKVIRQNHAYKIYDTMNIFVGWSAAKLGNFLGVPKLDKPEYLGQRTPKNLQEMAYFRKYAMNDAKICYEAGKWLINRFGKVTVSLPSLSFWYFNDKYKPYGLYFNAIEPLKSKLMLTYKGGRCEAFYRGTIPDKVYCYDVKSLYPSVMYNNYFPMGRFGYEVTDDINLKNEGFAYVTVSSDLKIPFLGIKHLCKDGNVKLVFPNGTFKGWFTYPEIRFFKNELKQKIITVHEAYETTESSKYFKDYVDEFYELKNNDVEHASFWKLCMNSLYGKFAQDAHSPELSVVDDGTIKIGKKLPNKKQNFKTNILVSAYITSYARIKLYRLMQECGYKNLVYTDTDSIHSLKPMKHLGENLGDLAYVTEGTGTYIRSKFYLIDSMVKCRGMEHIFTAEHVKKLIAQNDVECMSRTLLRLRSAFRQHKPFLTQQETTKHFSLNTDCKREYLKDLKGEALLTDYCWSNPVTIEVK